jgi:antitoxin CptB
MSPPQHNRLRWRCRRGLLELDIVLQRLWQKDPPCGDDLRNFEALLELPDNDLWDIVIGRSERYDERLKAAVARLRAA